MDITMILKFLLNVKHFTTYIVRHTQAIFPDAILYPSVIWSWKLKDILQDRLSKGDWVCQLSLDSGCMFLDRHSFGSSITPTVPVNAAIRTDSLALDCFCVSRYCVFVPVHSSNIFNGELLLGS